MDKVTTEEDTGIDRKLLAKDALRESQTCRLCGRGCFDDGTGECKADDVKFLPLYEDKSSEEKLSVVINKYLPLQVLEADLIYPRVICSDCDTSLRHTVKFFDKITQGQKILSKIVNSKLSKEDQQKVDDSVELKFAEDNPVIKAPKKRGRPRRVPKTTSEEEVCKTDVSIKEVVLEPRSKRVSRKPVRFTDSVLKPSGLKSDSKNDKTELDENVEHQDYLAALAAQASNQDNVKNPDNLSIACASASTSEEFAKVASSDLKNEPKVCEKLRLGFEGAEADDDMLSLYEEHKAKDDKDFKVRLKNATSSHPTEKSSKKRRQTKTIRRPVKKYFCEKCPKSFNHSASLLYHRNAAHEIQKNFTCEICGRAFTHKQLLKTHSYVHLEEKCFACDICNSKFKSRSSMYTHKKSIHSKVKEFTCEVCGIQFNLKSSLKSHMRLHTGEKPFKCDFCPKSFAQRSSFREHRRIHTGERPYVCNICTKSFTTGSQLRSHKFSHSESKTHLCQICGKGFTHAENFKYHMRRHSNERPLECQQCKKQFSEPWAFRKHSKLHTGAKPYKCDQCNKAFADPSNFAKHKKIHPPPTNSNTSFQSVENRVMPVSSSGQSNLSDFSSPLTSSDVPQLETPTENQPSIVHIVASTEGGFGSPVSSSDQDQVQQVIYVYGDNGPLFTFAMADGTQTQEVKPINELADLNCMETLDERVTESTTQDFESHYYTLETIDGDTVAVPIALQRPSNVSESTITELTSSSPRK